MCNRYNSITAGGQVGLEHFLRSRAAWVAPRTADVPPTVFPGYLGAVIRLRDGEPGLDAMRFGLVLFWAKDPHDRRYKATYNARSETIDTLATFREAFKRRRCVVPAESFAGFPTIEGGKLLHLASRADGEPIHFAGIWDRWSRDGEELLSYAIITAEPDDGLRWLHHRLPVILEERQVDAWMDPGTSPDELRSMLVSPKPTTVVARAA